MEHDIMKKEDWGNDIMPFDENEDSRRRYERDELGEPYQEEERDPDLDPGFSSWSDFNRYMYG